MSKVQNIMTADPTGSELVLFAEQTASTLVKNNLTRAQIRNIFTEVRKIEALWDSNSANALRRLTMLKPKLDYQTARTPAMGELKTVLSEAVDMVANAPEDKRAERFSRFINLFEAILAYHRARGGRS